MKPLITRVSERLFPRGPLRYLPPDALFWHPPIGADLNNRLRPLTAALMVVSHIYERRSVLDLWSNAGHFPILYAEHGATVTAVEPRKCFRRWFDTSLKVFWPQECQNIEWISSDMRHFTPQRSYDVVSCLGLIYHVPNAWEHLARIVQQCAAKTIILESQLFPGTVRGAVLEFSLVSTMTCNGRAQWVPRPTISTVGARFKSFGWDYKLLLKDWCNDRQSRGLWLVAL